MKGRSAGSRQRLISFLLLIPLLLVNSCSREPKLGRIPGSGSILAFGDSITFGTGAGTVESYPAVLEQMVGRKVVNGGVPGEGSAEGAARFPELLEAERPALLILCHGGNDLLRHSAEAEIARNIRTMIEAARERGVDVVLIGVPAANLSLTPPAFYRDLANEFRIPYDGDILPAILGKAALKSDYIHPNAAGYRELARALANLLKRCGAIG